MSEPNEPSIIYPEMTIAEWETFYSLLKKIIRDSVKVNLSGCNDRKDYPPKPEDLRAITDEVFRELINSDVLSQDYDLVIDDCIDTHFSNDR